jgi:hypothetical protein
MKISRKYNFNVFEKLKKKLINFRFGYPLSHQSFVDIPWKNDCLRSNDVMKFDGKISIPLTAASSKNAFKRKSELNDYL